MTLASWIAIKDVAPTVCKLRGRAHLICQGPDKNSAHVLHAARVPYLATTPTYTFITSRCVLLYQRMRTLE